MVLNFKRFLIFCIIYYLLLLDLELGTLKELRVCNVILLMLINHPIVCILKILMEPSMEVVMIYSAKHP